MKLDCKSSALNGCAGSNPFLLVPIYCIIIRKYEALYINQLLTSISTLSKKSSIITGVNDTGEAKLS